MNANDVLRGYELHAAEGGRLTEEEAVIVVALKLKAAAEANDGTTPVCDALREDLRYQEGCDWLKGFTELAERLERERNGLAAMLAELARAKAAQLADKTKKHDALWARLNPSIEYVEGTPVGYGEDEIDRQTQRAERAEAALAECRAKLEVDPRTKYDGIDCRDETIRMLEQKCERLIDVALHKFGVDLSAEFKEDRP